MTLGNALAIIVASLIFSVGCVLVSRAASGRRPLFRDPGAAAEGRNDVVFAVTILLGFLLLIAGNHYDTSANAARTEASAVESLAITADGINDTAARERIQHAAVCYLRTTKSTDWSAAEGDVGGETGGTPQADLWTAELGRSITAAARKGLDAYPSQDAMHPIRQARSERLYPGTPFSLALWVMSGLGVAIIIVLVAMLLAGEYAWVQYLVTCSTALILAFMLVLIGAFSRPFSSTPPMPAVSSELITTSLHDIELELGHGKPAVFGPCVLPTHR